jgi:hypothetical protein
MKPENKQKLEAQELDEEKPGLGQHVSYKTNRIRTFFQGNEN